MATAPTLQAALALVLLLTFVGLHACGATWGGLDRVRDAGVLRVAIDPTFPPFEFIDGDEIVGLDADLAEALAAELGVEAHFVTTNYDALYDALTAGRADVIISALYPDPLRSASFSFSWPYFYAGQVLVVPQDAAIAAISDLSGKSVACLFGTTGHMEALTWKETLEPPLSSLTTVEDPEEILDLLLAREVNAAVIDHVTALIYLSEHPEITIVWPPVTDEPYVVAARQEDQDLLDEIDGMIRGFVTDGTIDALVSRWMHP